MISDDPNQPNRLKVVDSLPTHNDNSVIDLSQKKMDELQLFRGDTVFVAGNKNHEAIGIVLVDDTCPDDCLRINSVFQDNIGVHSGDFALIRPVYDVKYGKHVHITPANNNTQNNQDNLCKDYIQPYFLEAYRPICIGDTFSVRRNGQTVEFQVVNTEPSPCCIVAPDTTILLQSKYQTEVLKGTTITVTRRND